MARPTNVCLESASLAGLLVALRAALEALDAGVTAARQAGAIATIRGCADPITTIESCESNCFSGTAGQLKATRLRGGWLPRGATPAPARGVRSSGWPPGSLRRFCLASCSVSAWLPLLGARPQPEAVRRMAVQLTLPPPPGTPACAPASAAFGRRHRSSAASCWSAAASPSAPTRRPKGRVVEQAALLRCPTISCAECELRARSVAQANKAALRAL
jgi:hypothetical protein